MTIFFGPRRKRTKHGWALGYMERFYVISRAFLLLALSGFTDQR